jgi:ubiquinol oxidase
MEHTRDVFIKETFNSTPRLHEHSEKYKYEPRNTRDYIAKGIVRFLAATADLLFKERYGHRAIVLETIAAVPGMVGGLLQHLKSLRHVRDDRGWIRVLIDEAENERMHLLIYSKIAKPTALERVGIVMVQFLFYHFYLLLYLISPKTAHRVVGYFEEEAIHSYEKFKSLLLDGTMRNVHAPDIAKTYWNLGVHATLLDVVEATIKDEMIHRDINHEFASDNVGTTLWK